MIDIELDKNGDMPLYRQLADKLYDCISEGVLAAETKLPTVRGFAKKLDVNPSTVVNAYKFLENKKAVYSVRGSGTYVADIAGVSAVYTSVVHKNTHKYDVAEGINFSKTSVSENLFPVKRFKGIFNEILDRDKGHAFSYLSSQGYEPLRITLAQRLEKKGIKTLPQRIQIISGAQQGIDIASKAMLTNNDVVFVEKLTYSGAIGAFLSRNAQIVQVDMESDGMDMNMFKKLLLTYVPKFVYITTYFQTPSCVSYSLKKKRELLELAYRYNFYIIEEDNLSDFNYSETQPVTLKALDYKNKVIYIKSFSKILMPGLRLGYMVLPKTISERVADIKYSTDISTSGFIQRAFEVFLKGRDWDNHITYMTSIFKAKYNLMVKEVNKNILDYVDFVPPEGGLKLWLTLKNKNIDADLLFDMFAQKGVAVIPGNAYSIDDNENVNAFNLSFADVTDEEIKEGVKRIREVFEEMT